MARRRSRGRLLTPAGADLVLNITLTGVGLAVLYAAALVAALIEQKLGVRL